MRPVSTPLLFAALIAAALPGCSSDTQPAPSAKPTTPAPAATTAAPTAAASDKPVAGKDFVTAQQILITWKGADRSSPTIKRSKDEAKKLADEVHKKAVAGEDFGELAKANSDDPDGKERLGNLGTIKKGGGKLPVHEKVFDLPEGGISEVIESKMGFHIFKRTQ